jgi:hypothetical protein
MAQTIALPILAVAKPEGRTVPRRISSRVVDLGKVHSLILSVGMATLIELPAPINGKIPGSPEADLLLLNGPQPNQVIVELKRANARPTNLILVSGKRKVVFDIIPSDPKSPTHQDIYEIVGYFGGPEMEDGGGELIDSSERPPAESLKSQSRARKEGLQ